VFIYGARSFHSRRTHTERKIGADFLRRKMESIYGASFWSMYIS